MTRKNYELYKHGRAAHWSYKLHRATEQNFEVDEVNITGDFERDFMALRDWLSKWLFIFRQLEEADKLTMKLSMKPLRLNAGSIPADFAALRDVDIFDQN